LLFDHSFGYGIRIPYSDELGLSMGSSIDCQWYETLKKID